MNAGETKVYKSPKRKLLRFFERSRNQWKIKCKAAKATVKRLNNRVRYLENSKADWKSKAIELEKKLADMKTRESRAPDTGRVKKTAN